MEKFNHNKESITEAVGYSSVDEAKNATQEAVDKLAQGKPLTYDDKKAILTYSSILDGRLTATFIMAYGDEKVIGDKKEGTPSEIIEIALKSDIPDNEYKELMVYTAMYLLEKRGEN